MGVELTDKYQQSIKIHQMAAQTQNIQTLLKAERSAQDIIAAARVKKQARMKQAKDEAKQEVLEFKAKREGEFKKKEQEVLGDNSQKEASMQAKTETDIRELEERVAQTESAVID